MQAVVQATGPGSQHLELVVGHHLLHQGVQRHMATQALGTCDHRRAIDLHLSAQRIDTQVVQGQEPGLHPGADQRPVSGDPGSLA